MNLPDQAQCRECETTFSPDVVYRRFQVDFAARTGFAFVGRRPDWVRNFCSEPCRRKDNRDRIRAQNDKTAQRRADER